MAMLSSYIKYSPEQLDKIGNTIIYLTDKLGHLSKTKILKLLYLLDEISIKKSGIPFVNLNYDVWKFGPVDRDIYIELSSHPNLLEAYINREVEGDRTYVIGKKSFEDDEFSDFDMELLDKVVADFGAKTSRELVSYTHKKGSPWYNLAKENDLLEKLENEEINSTELKIDLKKLIEHDLRKKSIFEDYLESH